MKILLQSDIHLEHYLDKSIYPTAEADVLVLAGDICSIEHIINYLDFWKHCNDHYRLVLYVMGNHEHYYHNINDSKCKFEMFCNQNNLGNIIVLENNDLLYEGYYFMGATLWTDCEKDNPVSKLIVQNSLADYRLIRNNTKLLTTEDTVSFHKSTVDYLTKTYDDMSYNMIPCDYKGIIVITHHAPSYMSVSDQFKGDPCNGGFVSDLDDFILNRPNIVLWCHGHVHSEHDYKIGSTRVLANPAGYPQRMHLRVSRENKSYKHNFVVEV